MIKFLLQLLLSVFSVAWANPIISEFMADNKSTIADEDGAYSDWIEIHNPTGAAISLAGWKLTDQATNPAKWTFPAISLQPGEFRLFFASEKHLIYSNHTNFRLSAGGEYLALISPTGVIVQEFAPNFPALKPDESYGRQFNFQRHIAAGTSWRYRVPSSNSQDATWKNLSFSDLTWSSGTSGFGFGLTVPGIAIRQVFSSNYIDSLAIADSVLALTPGSAGYISEASAVVGNVNFLGDGGDGHYSGNAPPPGGNGNNYVIRATGFINIPTAGFYTFGLNSDDGGRIRINGANVMVDDTNHGPEDHLGSVNLTAGLHSFDVVMFQGYGGNCVEFFAAPGQLNAWDASFRLVGDTASGGLYASTPSNTSSGAVIGTNVENIMKNIRGSIYSRKLFSTSSGAGGATSMYLLSRHADGFAAWINGQFAASENAPATPLWNSVATAARTDVNALIRKPFNLTSLIPKITTGNNLLCIQGLNNTVADSKFLILPELVSGSVAAGNAYFGDGKATPGWVNTEYSFLGKVQDTQFSHKRGFYQNSFPLTITTGTPGATIRYTVDGSAPTETNGSTYTAPISITGTTIVRAAAFKLGWESTDVDTQSFLFVNDIINQSPNGQVPPFWPSSSGTDQVMDFGMDPEIVNHANPNVGGAQQVKNALLSIPTVCLTTDIGNLINVNGSQGIYSNPYGRGFSWEKPVSVEWILPPDAANPNGISAFQENAGVRLRGGFSRSPDNPKHSFHLYFREEYGAKKLNYPLFGRFGAREFDQIDLRTSQNYSWAFGGDGRNTFLREESTRETQRAMGQLSSHLQFCHVYLNGIYWGLFNLEERTEAAYASSYMGGNKSDYDVVKGEQDAGYVIGATDGNLNDWQNLWNLSRAHAANPTQGNYFKMMGRAEDGVTPTSDPVLLNDTNLIDYLLLSFWTGNLDGCTSAFLGDNNANNWFGIRRRVGNTGDGFRFFVHDFEHTFFDVNEDRTGPFGSGNQSSFPHSNPYFLHLDLSANAEYRIRWADRIQKHMFSGGALTPGAWQNRVNQIATVVDQCIIAESARWGDAKSVTPLTKLDWQNAQNELINYFNPRHPVVLQQLRNDGLYPSVDAPTIQPFGGYQPSGVELAISGPAGATLYYMPDGSDPRAIGGTLRSGAQTHSSAITSENLIPWSASSWRYLSNASNQGTAWREPGFNDTSWPMGTAELGYGDGDEATAISIPSPRYATYFRKTFNITDTAQIVNLAARIEYDDAYAIYLNGTRIAGNLPTNPAFNYFSGSAIEDTIENISNINPALLVNGQNVIAIQIHQANGTSSDVSMNFSLTATRQSVVSPFTLHGNGERKVRFRALQGGTWSAMSEATFFLNTQSATASNLAISEIMYHPIDPSPAEIQAGFSDADDFEFIEIHNPSSTEVDLRGLYIFDAVEVDLDATGVTTLSAGQRALLVSNFAAFNLRYGNSLPVIGQYRGQLNNAGETITIRNSEDQVVRQFTYLPSSPWPADADGLGQSIVLFDSLNLTNYQESTAWRASASPGGNPGASDAILIGPWLNSFGLTDPLADPDRDGKNNLTEYALGGNPVVHEPNPPLVIDYVDIPTLGTHARLTHRRRYATDSVRVFLESTNALDTTWNNEGELIGIQRSGADEIWQHRSPHSLKTQKSKFWRLRIQVTQ